MGEPGEGVGKLGCEDAVGEDTDVKKFVTIVPLTVQKGLDFGIRRA